MGQSISEIADNKIKDVNIIPYSRYKAFKENDYQKKREYYSRKFYNKSFENNILLKIKSCNDKTKVPVVKKHKKQKRIIYIINE